MGDTPNEPRRTFVHVPANGSAVMFEVSDDLSNEVSQVQERVGGVFTSVGVPGSPLNVFVHDEGLWLDLPVNRLASVLAGQTLVGDAVVTGPVDDEGASLGCTLADVKAALASR